MATSHAQEDTGLAPERNRNRLDPFERFGAISRWRLEAPLDTNAIDPQTITNALIRVDYNSLEGGTPLRDAARTANLLPPQKNQSQLFMLADNLCVSVLCTRATIFDLNPPLHIRRR